MAVPHLGRDALTPSPFVFSASAQEGDTKERQRAALHPIQKLLYDWGRGKCWEGPALTPAKQYVLGAISFAGTQQVAGHLSVISSGGGFGNCIPTPPQSPQTTSVGPRTLQDPSQPHTTKDKHGGKLEHKR